MAAALGPLAQAVVLGAPDDLRLVLEGDDVLEALVLDGERPPSRGAGPAPAGTRDLWELVSGPEQGPGDAAGASCRRPRWWSDDVRLSLDHVAVEPGRRIAW